MNNKQGSNKTATNNQQGQPVTYRRTVRPLPPPYIDAAVRPVIFQTADLAAEIVPPQAPKGPARGKRPPQLEAPHKSSWQSPKKSLMKLAAWTMAAGAGLGALYLRPFGNDLSGRFVMANGRAEALRIDVATKCPGRINEVLVNEGDEVTAGQTLARIDATEVEAQLLEAEAGLRQSRKLLDQAGAFLAQRVNERDLAGKQLERTEALKRDGYATEEVVDARRSATTSAKSAVDAADAQVSVSRAGVDASAARVSRIKSTLRDCEVKAPTAGRVQHRIASPGEVLPAGARIITLFDMANVHMTVFLPMADAGRVNVNADARLVLDAAPDYVIPAYVSFIATEAQFTPKYVETKSEREKLMFRVKVQVPKNVLAEHPDLVKVGVPGEAYVRLAADASWPAWLEAKLPPAAPVIATAELKEPMASEYPKGPSSPEARPEQ